MSATSAVASARSLKSCPATEQRSSPTPLVLIIAAFLMLCLPLAYYLNIWQDEAYSLHSSSGSLSDALRQGLGFEAQAPLYFVLLAAWRELNSSAFFARLLSVAFSVVTLLATWSFARRYILAMKPTFVLAAVAFNPFTVWAAVEIRPYAASIAYSALLLLLLFRGFVDERPSLTARIAYLCVAIAGTYTQYYVAFLVPAHLFALLMLHRWTSAKRFVVYGVALGVSLVPLVMVLPQQLQSYHAFAVVFKIPSFAMAIVLFGYPFPHGWIESWVREPVQNGLYFLATLVPFALGVRYLRHLRPVTKALLYMVGALFATYTAVIVITHVHVIVPRHTLVMLVPLLVACFALIADVATPRRWLVLASYAAIYALFTTFSLWHEFHALSKVGDWHRVSDFVASNARPGDGVALFNAEAELPFQYYFKKAVPVAAIPRTMSFDRFDEETFVLHNYDEVAQSFGRFASGRKRVWLIESQACTPHYSFFGCKYLTQYVKAHFRVIRTTSFDGSTVIELEPRSLQQRPVG